MADRGCAAFAELYTEPQAHQPPVAMRSPINRKSTRTADSMLVTARQALWPYLQAYTAHMDRAHQTVDILL